MKSFPKERLSRILADIDALARKASPLVAAFDADGTLWDMDLGESFFEYQIHNRLVELPPDPVEHYHRMKDEVSKPAAYLWLAQINKGQRIETVRAWASECVQVQLPLPIYEPVRQVIQHLKKHQAEIYVVTASIKWAVEPGADLLGIPQDNVIGITTRIENGLVTDRQDGPITYREGKVEGLLQKTKGRAPHFAAGNTEGDLPLLESSLGLRLVVAGSDKGSDVFDTEQEMARLAKKKSWHCLEPA